ncbi:MAG: aromatic amino acid lyase, partial [Treponemataceae bacterium]|nr:aromatic amino acid lyase [Treponemataceae bacterium]
MKTIVVKGEGLTIDDVCDVAAGNAAVRLCDEKPFWERLKKSRDFLLRYIASGLPTYRVTTKLGDSCDN